MDKAILKAIRIWNDSIFLDPYFWQALGKAEGWEPNFIDKTSKKIEANGEWLQMQHEFIDHLAEGKDIDSFFINLLQSNGTN